MLSMGQAPQWAGVIPRKPVPAPWIFIDIMYLQKVLFLLRHKKMYINPDCFVALSILYLSLSITVTNFNWL